MSKTIYLIYCISTNCRIKKCFTSRRLQPKKKKGRGTGTPATRVTSAHGGACPMTQGVKIFLFCTCHGKLKENYLGFLQLALTFYRSQNIHVDILELLLLLLFQERHHLHFAHFQLTLSPNNI